MDWIMIAAIGQRGELGLNGHLPWNHPEDLQFFKDTTKGCPLIMGRKTFESLPGVLKGRPHLILSTQPLSFDNPNVFVFSDPKQIQQWCQHHGYHRAYVIGGSQIYKLLAMQCSQIVLTHMDHTFEADTFFPLEVLSNRRILQRTPLDGPSFQEYGAEIVYYGPDYTCDCSD